MRKLVKVGNMPKGLKQYYQKKNKQRLAARKASKRTVRRVVPIRRRVVLV